MRKIGVVVAATLLAVGMARTSWAEDGVTDNEITIGVFAPLSGSLANYGTDVVNAAKMMYERANAAGGVNGRKIRFIIEDAKCSPNDANAVAKKLVTVDKVFLLNGGSCTGAASAIQGYVERVGVPHVMLNASGDPALFPPSKHVFGGFGGTQNTVGNAMMKFAIEKLRAKTVSYIATDDDYGLANYAAAKAVADAAGVKIVSYDRIPKQIDDVTPTMLRVLQAKPDVIISASYPQGAVLIAQARGNYGMTQPLIQATQGLSSPALFAKNVGDDSLLKDFYFTDVLIDQPDSKALQPFYDMYRTAYPDRKDIASYMPFGIASSMTVLDGLKRAGRNLTREGFVDALEKTNLDTGVYSGPVEFGKVRRDAVRSNNVLKFDGKTSEVVGRYNWDGTSARQ
jgi:branched-chain amino acid transport system substrate-binding protein